MAKSLSIEEINDRIEAIDNIDIEVDSHKDHHVEHGVKFDSSYTHVGNVLSRERKRLVALLDKKSSS